MRCSSCLPSRSPDVPDRYCVLHTDEPHVHEAADGTRYIWTLTGAIVV